MFEQIFNQMPPVQIIANGRPITIGEPIPASVKSLEISHIDFGIQVPKHEVLPIAQWLWDIVQKCENDYITYQGVLILKSEVKEFSR